MTPVGFGTEKAASLNLCHGGRLQRGRDLLFVERTAIGPSGTVGMLIGRVGYASTSSSSTSRLSKSRGATPGKVGCRELGEQEQSGLVAVTFPQVREAVCVLRDHMCAPGGSRTPPPALLCEITHGATPS